MNEFQIGKDIGEILARLRALEDRVARCGCCSPCACGKCGQCGKGGGARGGGPGGASPPVKWGTKADPIPCVPYTPRPDDQYCVYRVIDIDIPEAGTSDFHAQDVICIVCDTDEGCETDEFWIRTLHGKYQLTPQQPPGSDFCRNCPQGGHALKRFR